MRLASLTSHVHINAATALVFLLVWMTTVGVLNLLTYIYPENRFSRAWSKLSHSR